jgi:hypothetical protein
MRQPFFELGESPKIAKAAETARHKSKVVAVANAGVKSPGQVEDAGFRRATKPGSATIPSMSSPTPSLRRAQRREPPSLRASWPGSCTPTTAAPLNAAYRVVPATQCAGRSPDMRSRAMLIRTQIVCIERRMEGLRRQCLSATSQAHPEDRGAFVIAYHIAHPKRSV